MPCSEDEHALRDAESHMWDLGGYVHFEKYKSIKWVDLQGGRDWREKLFFKGVVGGL
jgi:hypothetical protein